MLGGVSGEGWQHCASSADGTKLALNTATNIFTSTDSGATWITRTSAGNRSWASVASSADGNKLVAAVNSGYLYVSNDAGVTWEEQTAFGVKGWYQIALTADGGKLFVASYYNRKLFST